MRTLPCVLFVSLLIAAPAASAQDERKTDAQQDGLIGPVKSVSTTVAMQRVKWAQPSGPGLVLPVWCRDCTYDPDGTKTTSGQYLGANFGDLSNKFAGDLIELRRDGNGNVTERLVTSSLTGKLFRHEIDGPFGKIHETDYDTTTGILQAEQIISYDEFGHLHEWLSLDGSGKQASDVVTDRLKDGTLTAQFSWGKNGELSYQQIYDPETDLDRFITFDESGAVKLTRTYAHGKVLSFWEQPGLPHDHPQFGEGFTQSNGDGNVENYDCHSNGQCDLSRVHYEYLVPAKKRNPTSAEWRDADGKLLYAGYCEYVLDSAGNWTHRKVWVYPSEQGDRTLYEEDSRTIAYW
jgi:hypothetical protein